MTYTLQKPWQKNAIIYYTQCLLHSYKHWTKESLLDLSTTPEQQAQALFEAPFVVVSQGIESDPILNYGNKKALELWELSWEDFIQLPGRETAEEMERTARRSFLNEASSKGFIKNYSGVRISSKGQRFYIQNVLVWNVLDENNRKCGQAAMFKSWKFV
ncbi:hypothetical protein NIES4071_67220 [Calothrix sp. NIES-4071]|nr:hypothetical protein NIES4071_67220 [Calothrix sp. NIES-4071]BAZ61000.1 hypothetical protein NIES4105_67180 [Calothrix sp. NIES-4105]